MTPKFGPTPTAHEPGSLQNMNTAGGYWSKEITKTLVALLQVLDHIAIVQMILNSRGIHCSLIGCTGYRYMVAPRDISTITSSPQLSETY